MNISNNIKVIIFDWVGVLFERNKGPIPNSEKILKRLKGKGYKLALITLAGEGIHKRKAEIDESGLSRFFDEISIAESKDEKHYKALIKTMKVNPGQCLVVDDQLPKLEKAKNIGCQVAWVKGSDRSHLMPKDKKWKPKLQLNSAEDLLKN